MKISQRIKIGNSRNQLLNLGPQEIPIILFKRFDSLHKKGSHVPNNYIDRSSNIIKEIFF